MSDKPYLIYDLSAPKKKNAQIQILDLKIRIACHFDSRRLLCLVSDQVIGWLHIEIRL